ncbi:riboflavin synthase domain-like protein [Dacryopinax primogenitus]|uniref:NADPH-dependent diflavin oxidoreductase 1 n=1 Tax=Dacryopinax primogenitus (strain DJM 731) TaxID=1858805 RepID=M5FNC4_DACPD|nr:riboflavin synthase domain-like protein [Dacryopinax primogenitus]EJT97200.1 riboflavin synthase domain-like protein [Dacryopinax primogenitus]
MSVEPPLLRNLTLKDGAVTSMISREQPDETSDGRTLLVLYGSESGNAQDVAERVGRDARRHHFKARVISMDAYDIATLIEEPLVIFVCSTSGQGVEPRNMTKLWKTLLRADLPVDLFDGMDFAVFGLGDSSYARYNWASKKLQRRLQSLGAREIWERGDADDQHYLGIDGAFDPWIDGLFRVLLAMYPLPPGVEVVPKDYLYPPRVRLEWVDSPELPLSNVPFSFPGSHPANLLRIRRLTRSDWYQDVRHIEFEFHDDVSYSPGDIAVLHPENDPDEVQHFMERMGWADVADRPFRALPNDLERPIPEDWPEVMTLRIAFTRYLDILGVPRRSFFESLVHFTADQLEIEKLQDFCSPEGQDDLYAYCHRVRRTIAEVLTEFRSVQIPQDYVFDVFPEIRPREFSIASSVKCHPRQVHLCVAIVQYKTRLKTPRKGVCTTWLTRLKEGDAVQIALEPGTMHLPPLPSTPILLVGPGTGVAPMRAFIEHRIQQEKSKENTLYFGCRSLDADCHYKEEWMAYQNKGQLVCRIAASRDQPRKVYVQNLIVEDAERVWRIVHEHKGYVLISGSSNKMPLAVRQAVEAVLTGEGKLSAEGAKEYVKRMEMSGRWQEECWS